jgi:hypothetical protein
MSYYTPRREWFSPRQPAISQIQWLIHKLVALHRDLDTALDDCDWPNAHRLSRQREKLLKELGEAVLAGILPSTAKPGG